ncbi:BQ5605_C007g04675 [Microbotryum silenes-dioicae]|uniref:BQ5605_C007g04675 protein n=2 Tax=Microbotryum TaxID=34416 RepID=A0A2X0MC32_9BASI|nr:BQ5605_C007g04675 [Microbotryum silenes-dioicae]
MRRRRRFDSGFVSFPPPPSSATVAAFDMTWVALDQFDQTFGTCIELSSEALGGSIVAVSDEFFAPAKCLLRVPPSESLKGQFGPNGALFDGWESRRHCETYDWVIIKLGALGTLQGCDIDTGHFSGNESPASGVWGACIPEGETITESSPLWTPLLPITPLGPAQRHLFRFDEVSAPTTHVKLTMHPDGGIGRFRAYGSVVPAPSGPAEEAVDLAHVLNGGMVTGESDQHFGRGGNLILPGRGKDMGDGWETKRSRGRLGTGKGDWVVIQLAEPGYLEWADLDTNHFVGNFPQSAELYGIVSDEKLPAQDADWTLILGQTRLGPHRQHFFQLEHPEKVWTHVRLSIYPDGGVKRVRLFGRRASRFPSYKGLSPLPSPATNLLNDTNGSGPNGLPPAVPAKSSDRVPQVPAVPLTGDAFAKYGSVIQSYPDHRSARKDVVIKPVNFGTAFKFNHLSPVTWVQPSSRPDVKGQVNFCVFRCDAQNGVKSAQTGKEEWPVTVLERHEFSSQAFVPMGGGGGRYLVLVCLPNETDGQPDLKTLRAFMATHSQGISYHPSVWHHPIVALDATTDFACVVHETGVPEIDCEIKQFGQTVAIVHEV